MRMQLVPGPGQPTFLDLPWERPLARWEEATFVLVARGIGRHVVRFVEREGSVYALKELPARPAAREYSLLRDLARHELPVVQAVGLVAERGEELDPVLITRHLEWSLPYRIVLAGRVQEDFWNALLDALAELLVRLHLAGFFWGDCSLSNALFRRDAGALSAYLVDAETGDLQRELSAGQREHDLDIAEENIAGELLDVGAELRTLGDRDPIETAADVRRRYERLWAELTNEERFAPAERHRLEDRLRRLNELGFDVEEVEVRSGPDGYRLRLQSSLVEPGHHRRRLLHLTGLVAQERQARRLLADIKAFRGELEARGTTGLTDAAVAGRWLAERFEPVVAAVPPEQLLKRAPAELYHELLEHRWLLSEREGADVGLDVALRSYLDEVLGPAPEERVVLQAPPEPRDRGR
jgi:uncharacterized protein DUF4032/lipopolysaccharide kinase (Kdo/WaaP) family protein